MNYCDSSESRSSPSPPCGGLQLARLVLSCRRRRTAHLRTPYTPPPSFHIFPKGKMTGISNDKIISTIINDIRYLLRGQKVTPKAAAVKRFRGRSRDCAKSDACGTFEDQKFASQTFSRLGMARTSSALHSAYRKRSPIFNAPSPRPPFIRNRSLMQSFSRLGIARTCSALPSAYRKCSCRGIG